MVKGEEATATLSVGPDPEYLFCPAPDIGRIDTRDTVSNMAAV